MQTSIVTPTARHAVNSWGHSIDPITLAYLDFGLFKSLCKLGVSRERICSALTISEEDFDYLCKLSMT